MRRDPEKARAWKGRSQPLKRSSTPLSRVPLARSPVKPRQGRIMRPQSVKTGQRRADARPIREMWLRLVPECEMRTQGIGTRCYGALNVHEVWTRGRGGPIDDPRNFATACNRHNTDVSQDADAMQFAYDHGLLVKASAGKRWLEGGGRWPGMTRDGAIALLERLTATA